MEVCLPSRWQESPKCPTTPAQCSSGLSRSEPSVDKEPQTVWYEDAAMTFVGHVYVAVVGNCEHLMLLFYFIVFSMIFMTTSFICYLFFSSSQSLFAVSVSIHDFKTVATPRQAFSHSTLEHLGTKHSSGLSLCCITAYLLNREARKVSTAALFHMPLENHSVGRLLQKKEALCCFVSRLSGSVENLMLDLAFMLSIFCLCGLLPVFSNIQNVYIWFSRLYLGWVFIVFLEKKLFVDFHQGVWYKRGREKMS